MKKKKLKLLWPISNCCIKKIVDLDTVAKYGSITTISIILLSQIFNVAIGYNYRMSFFSMIINVFFLLVVLTKLEILKLTIFEEQMNFILKLMIFVFIINFFAYSLSTVELHSYFFAPVSFLGAYFIFILLTNK